MARFVTLLVLAVCFVHSQGVVRVLNFTKAGRDVTAEWQKAASGMTERDTVKVCFGSGKYYLSGTVEMLCNVAVTGKGASKSTLVCRAASRFTDDCFIKAAGHRTRTIAVDVSNVGINLEKHNGMLWDINSAKYLLKIYHANRVGIKGCSSYIDNAVCTNMSARNCSNIDIENCNFVNYNNSHDGGILWFTGNTEDVLIAKNDFKKAGNDEVIAFYGTHADDWNADYKADVVHKKNINVSGNKFWLSGSENQPLTLAFNLLNAEGQQRSEIPAEVRNVVYSGNEIVVAGDVRNIFSFQLEQNTTGEDISCTNNKISCLPSSSAKGSTRSIFNIVDYTDGRSPFAISGNEIDCNATVLDTFGYNSFYLLSADGAHIDFSGNKVTASAVAGEKQSGITGLYVRQAGGQFNLSNNNIAGLFVLASLSATQGGNITSVAVNAAGNRFEGRTTLFCNNIDRLDLNFDGNVFTSTSWEYFLQEFAKTGTLVFRNNIVNATNGGGSLLSHYSKVSTKSMRFERLEVQNNKFSGVSATQVLTNITNVNKRVVSGNRF